MRCAPRAAGLLHPSHALPAKGSQGRGGVRAQVAGAHSSPGRRGTPYPRLALRRSRRHVRCGHPRRAQVRGRQGRGLNGAQGHRDPQVPHGHVRGRRGGTPR